MPQNETILQALKQGDIELLAGFNANHSELFKSEEVEVALRRAAERVVGHRQNYRDVIKRAIELGAPSDIWTAARAGLVDLVRASLSENSTLLNATDSSGRTALQRAALVYGVDKKCEEVVDFLIASGAKLDVFTAATFGMLETLTNELTRDPNLIRECCEGSTPLNWAVRPRRNDESAPAICKALIDAGADVHDADEFESKMTPLHHAAEWGPKVCLQIVDLLLDAGADLQATDDQGWTPLAYAKDRGRKAMVEHLTKLGAT